MRPIDADVLLAKWSEKARKMARDKDGAIPIDFSIVISALVLAPTLDDPRSNGRWNPDGTCSYCGMRNPTCRANDMADYFPVSDVVFQHLQFCPDCGAKMDNGVGRK